MSDYIQAILLALIQALTEFLPISSSAHLILAPHILGDDVSSLTFDVGLHVGTLAATLIYFWRDWASILLAGYEDVRAHGARIARWQPQARLGLWIAAATVPVVIAGLLFDSLIEEHLRRAWVAGIVLIGFGLLLGLADQAAERLSGVDKVTPTAALFIGFAQVASLVPGVSRSGVTITAGRSIGLDRETAARFSFLLSAPAILGAATLELFAAMTGDEMVSWGPLAAGALTSGVAGWFVIHWLLRYVSTHSLLPFVLYRIGLGVVVLLVAGVGAVF